MHSLHGAQDFRISESGLTKIKQFFGLLFVHLVWNIY